MYVCLFFFCNDTAATEIYTYLPTLSLHDALPIFSESQDCPSSDMDGSIARQMSQLVLDEGMSIAGLARAAGVSSDALHGFDETDWRPGTETIRSEEHTSELQSLMRSSYAVFCLKKKTLTQQLATLRLTKNE